MKSKYIKQIVVAFALLITNSVSDQGYIAFSQEARSSFTKNSDTFDHSHTIFNTLLKKYVHNAKVDYNGFINSSENFNNYIKQLANVRENNFTSWIIEQNLAFWINAYNAFTIKAIIEHYPIERNISLASIIHPKESIRQIDGVWDKLKFNAVGRMVTLNEIEHEILRKEFNEPRIHFAIVCASIGCPDLRSEAYIPDVLENQLQNAASNFINNNNKGVEINIGDATVKLSKIFKWFGEDFIGKYNRQKLFKDKSPKDRAVLNFILEYTDSQDKREFLQDNEFEISYLDYDWSLNELKIAEKYN